MQKREVKYQIVIELKNLDQEETGTKHRFLTDNNFIQQSYLTELEAEEAVYNCQTIVRPNMINVKAN